MKAGECHMRVCKICSENDSVFAVAQLLKSSGERNIIVTNGKSPVGIISVTDISSRVVAEGKDPKKTKASEIMTIHLMLKESSEDLAPLYVEMLKRNIYSCVIVDSGKLMGMLDLKEAMNCIVKEKKNHGKGKK